jgi:hypothetical protein
MEATAAMEAGAAAETRATSEATTAGTGSATEAFTAAEAIAASEVIATAEASAATEATAISEAAVTTIEAPETITAFEAVSIEVPETPTIKERATVPRTSADKDAAVEPAWTVVTVRRAGVRVISVVAVFADGRRTVVTRGADPHADRNSLRLRVGCGTHANTKYRENSQVSHFESFPRAVRFISSESFDSPNLGCSRYEVKQWVCQRAGRLRESGTHALSIRCSALFWWWRSAD